MAQQKSVNIVLPVPHADAEHGRRPSQLDLTKLKALVDASFYKQRRVKDLIPLVILTIFSLVSGGLIYGAEQVFPPQLYLADGPSVNGCVGTLNYWAALEYSNSIITTIGYGNVYACTPFGRFVTVLSAIIGVPLVVISLNNIGNELATLVQVLYSPIGRTLHKLKRSVAQRYSKKPLWAEYKQKVWTSADDVPMWAIITVNFFWITVAAIYFCIVESWTYWDSFYFMLISTATIGLGDYAPRQFSYTILSYAFIFVGLALVSASIKLVQTQLENLMQRFEERLAQMKRKTFVRRKLGLVHDYQTSTLPEHPTEVVDEFMRQNWLTWLLPYKRRAFLEKQAAKVLTFDAFTQTDSVDLRSGDEYVLLHRCSSLEDMREAAEVPPTSRNASRKGSIMSTLSRTNTAHTHMLTHSQSRMGSRRSSLIYLGLDVSPPMSRKVTTTDLMLREAEERRSFRNVHRLQVPTLTDFHAHYLTQSARPTFSLGGAETPQDILEDVPEEADV